jgi:hypothetical protein
MIYYLYGDDMMNNRGIVIKSSVHQSENYRTVSDPAYLSDLLECVWKLFVYAREKRDFMLKHKTNRSSSRATNQNIDIQDVSIIDLMNEFIAKKDFRNTYSFPQNLLFIKKFFRTQCSSYDIAFSSFSKAFNSLHETELDKRYKNITFEQIATEMNKLNDKSITAEMVESDYTIIKSFFKLYRSRN